jgi:glc operon protein GlcG
LTFSSVFRTFEVTQSEFFPFQRKEDVMKMNRWFALVVVVIMGFASGVFAQSPPPYGLPISLEMAKKAAAAAVAEAKKNNWCMAVVITDGSGSLVYLERIDNTQYGSVDVAINKAKSATAYRRPTKDFADILAQGGPGNRVLILPYAMPIEGGLPIIIDGKVVGAIGASGGTAQQDGIVATAGVNALK